MFKIWNFSYIFFFCVKLFLFKVGGVFEFFWDERYFFKELLIVSLFVVFCNLVGDKDMVVY